MNLDGNKIKVISELNDFTFVHKWYDLADENHFWMQWRLRAFLNQIEYLGIAKDVPLLGMEIGCGHGVFRKQVEQETKWVIDGTDLDYQALEKNPECRGETYAYDIMERRSDFKEKYDFIILFDVLEHIEDSRVFLDASLFHLKKGGYLFVNVPALPFLFSAYDRAAGHIRRYNKRTLSKDLGQCRLQTENIRYWGFFSVGLLLLRKLIISSRQTNERIIRKGFEPPGRLANFGLNMLMKIETTSIKQPFLGTSVMAVAKKP